jgi:hypothetical protein
MQLQLQTFTTLVQNMAAAVQSAAAQLLDLTVGSALRAVLEANASIALWMQWLILQVLQTTRAATSGNADLDSWMDDFSLTRLPAVSASGIVTFSRFTPAAAAFIPVGALVRTGDGTQIFAVTASPASPAFSPARDGYTLSAGITALDTPVQAQVSGISGNVQTAAINLLVTAIPGIDAVTNAHAFRNGLDAETDDAFRNRFTAFIDSRSRATPLAVGYAISQIQQGLEYAIQENIDPADNPRIGSFVVTVDDGSGSPSASLLTAVNAAVEAVRPVGSTFTIRSPTIVLADVTLSISVGPGGSHIAATVAAQTAIVGFVNDLPIGATLPLTKIAQLAYAADAAITNVSQLEINTIAADLTPPATGVVKAGIVTVN